MALRTIHITVDERLYQKMAELRLFGDLNNKFTEWMEGRISEREFS